MIANRLGEILIYDSQQLTNQNDSKKVKAVEILQGIHRKTSCETLSFHPSNTKFASGGSDGLIAEWDTEDLMCSGTYEL